MSQEIVVVIEEEPPDIVVVLEGAPPDIDVTVSEVALGGPKGEQGEQGEQGDPGPAAELILDNHINSPLPHPVYDDGPSFFLLYQNAKV